MPHYYSKKQISALNKKTITVRCFDHSYEFITGSGVFSKDHLDKASQLLIENAQINGTTLLDLGCGIGVIGIILAKQYAQLQVTLTDVNERAVMLAKKNAQKHQIQATIVQGDLFEHITSSFDMILLNPPQTAGRDVCYAMIEQSFAHLIDKGTLQIVARHQKGGKMLMQKMQDVFGNVETIAKQGGFRVYLSKKLPQP